VTLDRFVVDETVFTEGVMFDGYSIAGWKAINESDMVLLSDPTTLHRDPFFAEPTLVILCDVHDPTLPSPTIVIRVAPPERRRPISNQPAPATSPTAGD
jgi:glutamine synthetase